MPDPSRLVGLQTYLKNDPEVGPAVRGRVFLHKIPDSFVSQMPKACLVIKPAGSPQAFQTMRTYYSDSRVDIDCFAWQGPNTSGDDTAYDLAVMVKRVLTDMPRNVSGGVILHWCRPGGGPVSMRYPGLRWPESDPDAQIHWPRAVVTFQVLAADVTDQVA